MIYDIAGLFSNYTDEQLQSMFTKAQLKEMYVQVYGSNPLSSMNKMDIILRFRKRFHGLQRTMDIINMGYIQGK